METDPVDQGKDKNNTSPKQTKASGNNSSISESDKFNGRIAIIVALIGLIGGIIGALISRSPAIPPNASATTQQDTSEIDSNYPTQPLANPSTANTPLDPVNSTISPQPSNIEYIAGFTQGRRFSNSTSIDEGVNFVTNDIHFNIRTTYEIENVGFKTNNTSVPLSISKPARGGDSLTYSIEINNLPPGENRIEIDISFEHGTIDSLNKILYISGSI